MAAAAQPLLRERNDVNDVSTESLRAVRQLGDFEALAKMHLAADTKQALDRLSEWHKSSAMPILHEYANTHLKEHFVEFARCFQAIKQGQDWDSHDDLASQAIVVAPVAEKHAQLQAARHGDDHRGIGRAEIRGLDRAA